MDEPAKTLGEATSEEHDCVRELWWASTGCYFSEDSLDKAEKASIAFLESRNLRVIDPAKVMVLERRESVPEEGLPSGRYLMIENEFGDMVVTNKTRAQVYVNEKSAVAFGPIQLPPTEGR